MVILQAAADAHAAIYELDRAVQQWMRSPGMQHTAVLAEIARLFNWWGGSGVIWCMALCWLIARGAGRRNISELGLRSVESLAAASAVSGIVKGLAGRERPFLAPGEPWHWNFNHGWIDSKYFSMPSGHTTSAFAAAVAVVIVMTKMPRYRGPVSILAGISAPLVAFARLYTNQHWFTDVLTGALIGSVTAALLTRWHMRHPDSAFDRALLGAPSRGAQ